MNYLNNRKNINNRNGHINKKRNVNKNGVNKNKQPQNLKKPKRGVKVQPTHQKLNKYKLKKNVDKRVKVIFNNVTGYKFPVFIYFILIYISICSFAMLTFFSKVEQINKEIIEMQDEKQILMEEKRYLEITLESNYNMSNIKKFTEKNLNMKKPEEHQIIYIDIPKESSVNYNSSIEEKSFFNIFNN